MKQLRFEYELDTTHGWACAVFTLDDQRHVITHGYCTHPLAAIASIAVVLAKGGGLPRTEAVFDDEPGGHTGSFLHRDPTQFELRSFRDVSQRDQSPGDMVVQAEIDSIRFAASVGEALHRLLHAHGLAGYLQKWGRFAFPFQQYWLLRLLLDQSEQIDELGPDLGSTWQDELRILSADPQWASTRLKLRNWVEVPENLG